MTSAVTPQSYFSAVSSGIQHNLIPLLIIPLVISTFDNFRVYSFSFILAANTFDWIILTSPEAALVFLDAWKVAGSPNVIITVVGSGTTTIFNEATSSTNQLIDVAFVPSKSTGKVLASELPKHGNGNCNVLYPASEKASHDRENGFSNRGFHVTRLNTYTTKTVEYVDQMILEQALSSSVVAVASPSAIRAWMNLVSESDRWHGSIACIGITTASAAKKMGLKNVYYLSSPGLQGWVDSIIDALQTKALKENICMESFIEAKALNYSDITSYTFKRTTSLTIPGLSSEE
ncbi:hypothetical protein LXL04_017600 [Taraxacum kok-saghyz]